MDASAGVDRVFLHELQAVDGGGDVGQALKAVQRERSNQKPSRRRAADGYRLIQHALL